MSTFSSIVVNYSSVLRHQQSSTVYSMTLKNSLRKYRRNHLMEYYNVRNDPALRYYGTLIGTHMRCIKRCYFQRPTVIFNYSYTTPFFTFCIFCIASHIFVINVKNCRFVTTCKLITDTYKTAKILFGTSRAVDIIHSSYYIHGP